MTPPPTPLEKTTVQLQPPSQQSPQRIDSFPSLSMEEEPVDDLETDGGQSSLSLKEENEQLRAQIAQLQDKVTALQNRNNKQHQGKRHSHSRAPPPMPMRVANHSEQPKVLELTTNLRQQQANINSINASVCQQQQQHPKYRQSPTPPEESCSSPKEDRSFETDDDQETVEPQLDLQAHHRSADGLHHRSHYYNGLVAGVKKKASNLFNKSPSPSNPMKRNPSDSLEDNYDDDDENENDDDDNDEEEGLLTTATNNNNNNNTDEEDFAKNVWDRAGWLVGLLVLQSMSSFILARNEVLLQEHTIIIRFLTMLVGAGGNAGNQASVRGTL
jgi:hypothetical protein